MNEPDTNLTEAQLTEMRKAFQMTPEEVVTLYRQAFAIDAAVQAERARIRRMVGHLGAGMVLRAPDSVEAEFYFKAYQDGFWRCRSLLLDLLDTATPDVPRET